MGENFRQIQRLGLAVVIQNHQIGDLFGHIGQQLVTLLIGHIATLDHFIDQDFDIDLVVGAVHAARVVDKVGVDSHAVGGSFHPATLGQAQVTALADHTAVQLFTVDAQRVVGFITHVRIGLF